jgi:hypothetical protein
MRTVLLIALFADASAWAQAPISACDAFPRKNGHFGEKITMRGVVLIRDPEGTVTSPTACKDGSTPSVYMRGFDKRAYKQAGGTEQNGVPAVVQGSIADVFMQIHGRKRHVYLFVASSIEYER